MIAANRDRGRPHVSGYAISITSLPPAGTILSAKIMLPTWSDSRLAPTTEQAAEAGCRPVPACAAVRDSRRARGRLWAEGRPPRAREDKVWLARIAER